MRMNRAGRTAQIKTLLVSHNRKKPKQGVSVGWIAKKIGLRSSTHLRSIIEEICKDDDQFQVLSAGDHRIYRFMPYVQIPFEERFYAISINKHNIDFANTGIEQNQ